MAEDSLVKIDKTKLPKLRNLYAKNDEKTFVSYMVINNYIRWFEIDPSLKYVDFFCLNGDISDGTYVVTDRCSVYADTLSESPDNLYRLLRLLDYSKGYIFRTIRSPLHPTIMNVLKSLNLEVVAVDKAFVYCLSKADALQLDTTIPNGLKLKPLTEHHDLEKINSSWPHRSADSQFMFKRLAHFNLSVGAFLDDGTLVAWILRYPNGMIAALQTDKKYLGKSYGSLVTRVFSKEVAKMGDNACVHIIEKNTISLALFKKLGFKCISEVYDIKMKISKFSDDVGYNECVKKLSKI